MRAPALPRGPNFQSQGSVSPCTFRPLQTYAYTIPWLLKRKQAAGVCLIVLGPILWLPSGGDIPLQLNLLVGVGSHPTASEISKGGKEPAL